MASEERSIVSGLCSSNPWVEKSLVNSSEAFLRCSQIQADVSFSAYCTW